MDLRALDYYRTVADLGSISKAAAYLRIAQPALSRFRPKRDGGGLRRRPGPHAGTAQA